MNEHIIVVDDNKALCNIVAEQLETIYGDRYEIDKFYDARDVLEFINEDVDPAGDRLVMVASDERMEVMQGHELMFELTKSHPKTKKVIFSAWSDVEALKSGINSRIDGFASKADKEHAGDELFILISSLITEYEQEPIIAFEVNNITFKQAETLYEKQLYLKKRFEIYKASGIYTNEHFSPLQLKLKMDWDEFDIGESDRIVLSCSTRYILALKDGDCIGGGRVIDGKVPLEDSICLSDGSEFDLPTTFTIGEKFELDFMREQDIYIREISRLIVDEKYRSSGALVLIGLFRIKQKLTSDQNTLFCTSSLKQMGLYQAIGFEVIGPLLNYRDVELVPMMRDMWKAHNDQDSIPGINKKLHRMGSEPIPSSDIDKWVEYSTTLNEEAIRTGFYDDEQAA